MKQEDFFKIMDGASEQDITELMQHRRFRQIPADQEEADRAATSVAPATSGAAAAPKASTAVKGSPVLAPLNGTFYRSDAPGKPQMAADGASVKAGDAVCVVEAMKLFNPIKATASGKITFLVAHGTVVAKGQPVASIE